MTDISIDRPDLAVASDYTADHIITDRGLRIILRNPTQFITSTETAGIVHISKEVIDNSLDELTLKGADGQMHVVMCVDAERQSFQLIVRDNGRGIPLTKMHELLTEPHSSGKYTQSSYKTSTGQFGVGLKATTAMSSRFLGITHRRGEGIAWLLIENAEHAAHAEVRLGPEPTSGTTSVFEPSQAIFTGIAEFTSLGYMQLLELLKKYCFFTPYNITFAIHPRPVPSEVWCSDGIGAQAVLDQVIAEAEVVFTPATYQREEWLRTYWSITRPFAWRHSLRHEAAGDSKLRQFTVNLYFTKGESAPQRFGMINNIPMDSPESDHLRTVNRELIRAMAPRIKHAATREFFEKSYRLSVHIAVDVHYSGAKMTGATKHAYYDAVFREEYGEELRALFAAAPHARALDELFQLIEEDVASKYMASISQPIKIKNFDRIKGELNEPGNYTPCHPPSRDVAELFLVEGKSAGGSDERDATTMAIYELTGKPLNPVKFGSSRIDRYKKMQENEVYQDILKLLGLNLQTTDYSQLNFGKVVIMADAD